MYSVFGHNSIQIDAEKRKLQHILNWEGELGTAKSSIVLYKTGLVVSGPCGEVRVSNSKGTHFIS
jgi:hypothetical protein